MTQKSVNGVLPVHGRRESLRWAEQSDAGGLVKLEAAGRLRASELRRHPAHRLCACWEKESRTSDTGDIELD